MYSYAMSEMTKTDCFAFRKDSCTALTDRICDNRRCRFYKTQKEFDKTRTPSRLTWEQEAFLKNHGINPDEWLFVEATRLAMILCNKKSKEIRSIKKRGYEQNETSVN